MSKKESGCLSFFLFCSRDKSKNRSQSPRAVEKEMNDKQTQTQNLAQRRTDPTGINHNGRKSTIVIRDNNGFVLQSPREKIGIDSGNLNQDKKENSDKDLPGKEDECKLSEDNGKVLVWHKQSLSPFRLANDNSKPKIVAITPRIIGGRYLSNSRGLREKLK